MVKQTNELRDALLAAVVLFKQRGAREWAIEARDAIDQLVHGDHSFAEGLYLRYAPTGEVDELFITDYPLDDEDRVNELNDQLAKVINEVSGALEKCINADTPE